MAKRRKQVTSSIPRKPFFGHSERWTQTIIDQVIWRYGRIGWGKGRPLQLVLFTPGPSSKVPVLAFEVFHTGEYYGVPSNEPCNIRGPHQIINVGEPMLVSDRFLDTIA